MFPLAEFKIVRDFLRGESSDVLAVIDAAATILKFGINIIRSSGSVPGGVIPPLSAMAATSSDVLTSNALAQIDGIISACESVPDGSQAAPFAAAAMDWFGIANMVLAILGQILNRR